jgi:hypothetical protein
MRLDTNLLWAFGWRLGDSLTQREDTIVQMRWYRPTLFVSIALPEECREHLKSSALPVGK